MKFIFDDTIAAPATVPGTGALSIIRVSGRNAFEVSDKIIRFKHGNVSGFDANTIHYGTIVDKDGGAVDDVLVSVFKSPHSYTGEDSVEISCHASGCIVSDILQLLCGSGARLAEPGEFTKRAFLNGKMDLAQAEAVADLIASRDEASRKVALNQLRGGFSDELKSLRSDLLELTALMELELDFSEEDVEFADRDKLSRLLDKAMAKVSSLADSFRLGNAIKNGVPVAIVGAANSGKSTLLNALLKEDRAIVSDIPGTTRDTVEELLTIDGVSFRFIDTAGIRDTSEAVEKIGIERTYKKIRSADYVLYVIDPTEDFDTLCEAVKELLSKVDRTRQKVAVLVNKTDLPGVNKNVTDINELVSSIDKEINSFSISAKEGLGLDMVEKWLSGEQKSLISAHGDEQLVTNVRHYDALRTALSYLHEVKDGLAGGRPSDLVAQDLRDAVNALGTILGESVTPDETLGLIFSKFCIGK